MPLTDAFGGHGGIALYNRDVLRAMSDCAQVEQVRAVPRLSGPFDEPLPPKVDWRAAAIRGKAAFIAELARAVLSFRPLDVVWCAHANLLPLCSTVARLTRARLVLAIYGTEAWQPFERAASVPALRHVDRVVSISRYTQGRFEEWSGFDPRRISIVANAIDLTRYADGPPDPDLVERYRLAGKEAIMIFGRMHPTEGNKGFDELLEAMAQIVERRPGVAAIFAGDGGDRARLEEKARQLGVAEAVRFTGMVREEEKAAHYRLARAYVMPSRQEGFGFVHLEAMACGTNAVASMVDGAREAVRDGAIGRLIDPDDRESIVRETLAALDQPRGIPPGLEHFAYPRFAEEIAQVLGEVMR